MKAAQVRLYKDGFQNPGPGNMYIHMFRVSVLPQPASPGFGSGVRASNQSGVFVSPQYGYEGELDPNSSTSRNSCLHITLLL